MILNKILKAKSGAFKSTVSDSRGMTLIDLAIALVVIGLLAAPAIKAFDDWRNRKARGATQESLYAVKKAIADFYYEFERYPCPADLTLTDEDPTYGQEDCSGTAAAGGTLAGGIPFETLQMPSALTLDGWKDKITYVVTQVQTVAPMSENGGVITVRGYSKPGPDLCDWNTTIDFAPGNGHFILISHGPRGVGAFNAEGNRVQNCSGNTREIENCDYLNNATFWHYQCATSDDTANGNYYDDFVDYQASVPRRMWNYTTPDPDDIASNSGYIGINDDTPGKELDVKGNIKVENNVMAEEYCDETGTDCMPAPKVGGFDPLMNCAGHPNTVGGAAVGIGNNQVDCSLKFMDPGAPPVNCGNGFLTGFSGGGSCSTP